MKPCDFLCPGCPQWEHLAVLSLHNFTDSIMETKHKEAKQGNFIYSSGTDYQKRVLNQQFCHEWATIENREKKGCSYSSDFKVQKGETAELPMHLHYFRQQMQTTMLLQQPSSLPQQITEHAVNNSAHLNSVTSIPEGLNVTRSEPRDVYPESKHKQAPTAGRVCH